jgi:hypothetical protein
VPTRLVEARDDQQLVGVEQRFVALVVFDLAAGAALVGVAAQLVHRVGQRLGHRGALALDHHQRDAVHQQHEVGHDEGLAAVMARRAVDPVLVDHRELVALGVLPVDVVEGLAAAAVPAGQAFDRDAGEQQLGGGAVGLDQPVGGDAGDGADGLGDALIVEPGLALVQVQRVELAAQRGFLDDLGEAGAAGAGGAVEIALDVAPAHRDELLDEGAFDRIQFPAHMPPWPALNR